MIVTVDVSSLYTNIDQTEGLKTCAEILDKNSDNQAHNSLIIELLELVLKLNIFEFDNRLYRQDIGTAMGCKPAPDYANIFMADIDSKILQISKKLFPNKNYIKSFKRFLDDIFFVFKGSHEDLHKLLNEINQIHNNAL